MILKASRMFYSVKLCYFVLGNDAPLITAPEKPGVSHLMVHEQWVPQLHHSTCPAPAQNFSCAILDFLPTYILPINFHLKIYWRVTS